MENGEYKKECSEMNVKKFITSGYTKADNNLLREISTNINPQTYTLYLILLSHRNYNKETYSFPSISLISKEIGLSDRNVKNMLKKLSDCGYIKIISGNYNQNNRYFFPRENFYDEKEYQKFK